MAARRGAYMYGSAARVLPAEPQREVRRREERQPRPRPQPKKKIDKIAVLLTAFTFAAVMVVGIMYLHLQFESTYLSKSVVNLQSEVVELEKVNVTEVMKQESAMDLKQIYKKATKELGMVKAKDDQVFTYESKKSTQIRQHGNIPAK